MNNQTLSSKRGIELYSVEETPHGWAVHDRLKNQTFRVQRIRRKYVGACNCDEKRDINHQCSHQAAVRGYLMDRWWYGKEYKG